MDNNSVSLDEYIADISKLIKIIIGECDTYNKDSSIDLHSIIEVLSATIRKFRTHKKETQREIQRLQDRVDAIRANPRGTLGDNFHTWKDEVWRSVNQIIKIKHKLNILDKCGYCGITIKQMKHILTVCYIANELKKYSNSDIICYTQLMEKIKKSNHLNDNYKGDIESLTEEISNLLKYKIL